MKISSLSLLCLRTIYKNQINTDNIPSMILELDFYQWIRFDKYFLLR